MRWRKLSIRRSSRADQTRRGPLNHLLQQANVWGELSSGTALTSFAAPGLAALLPHPIRHPTRDLQHVLDALLDELGGLPSIYPGSPIARRA